MMLAPIECAPIEWASMLSRHQIPGRNLMLTTARRLPASRRVIQGDRRHGLPNSVNHSGVNGWARQGHHLPRPVENLRYYDRVT